MEHWHGSFEGIGGLHLFVQRWRPEEMPRATLAIVHGFGEHSGRYVNVVEYLVPKGYTVYGYDLRGHGRSPGQRGYISRWEEFREDTRAFLALVAREEPDRPLFLMGHSLGGLIVLDYAIRYPEGLQGVIASGPALAQTATPSILVLLSRVLSRLWPRFSIDTHLDASAISRDPAVVEAYRSDPLVHSVATARLGAEMNATMEWVNAHAAELQVPLLILHGGADRLVPSGASRGFFERVNLKDKERHEYEGGYHEPHNDLGKEQALADLEAWLEKHLG